MVTEDTVTRGTSLLEAARAVRAAGAEPVLLVAVVDRGGTVAAMAAAEGLAFRAVLTAPDLGFAYEGGLSRPGPGCEGGSATAPRPRPPVAPGPAG